MLVEIRTLIQEAEQRARSTQSPLHSPDDTTPFSIAFGGFSDDKDSSDLQLSEARAVPRTSRYDTLSVDSNSPIYTPGSRSPSSPALRGSPQPPSTDTSEFEEFLSKPRKFLEKDFSELTLTGTIIVLCFNCVVLCCAVLCCVVLCRVVSCCVVSCRVVLCRVVSCRVVSCCVVLCCVVLCCVVLCCVVLYF